jgi:hypothetical protein
MIRASVLVLGIHTFLKLNSVHVVYSVVRLDGIPKSVYIITRIILRVK